VLRSNLWLFSTAKLLLKDSFLRIWGWLHAHYVICILSSHGCISSSHNLHLACPPGGPWPWLLPWFPATEPWRQLQLTLQFPPGRFAMARQMNFTGGLVGWSWIYHPNTSKGQNVGQFFDTKLGIKKHLSVGLPHVRAAAIIGMLTGWVEKWINHTIWQFFGKWGREPWVFNSDKLISTSNGGWYMNIHNL